MKISLSIPEQNTITTHGYGVASYGIVRSLQRLGHEVPFQDSTAPVELNFSQPYLWQWTSKSSYKIGMVAWESTKIPANWKPGLKTCDELWTPSPLMAEWFKAQGYPAKVYEHGVDSSVWTPRKRHRKAGPVKFLHIGEPAPRKGGQMTYDAFKELFADDDARATLTIKGFGSSRIRGTNNAHPWKETRNVKVITEEYDEYQMVDLIHRHDVLVYPSYGEGFGLIPLQALATGMPVILSQGWAPYENVTLPELRVGTKLGPSPWPSMHPGNMFHPDAPQLEHAMAAAVNGIDEFAKQSFGRIPYIQKRWDWDRLTEKAFAPIVEKFGQ
jgi:glycosyltransferase involved in cell wall biosynthesis